MTASPQLAPARLLAIFTEEITSRSGVVHDTFQDRKRLFTRSILPRIKKVRKNDRLQGGVAVRSNVDEIWLHPYVFRQVCSNGAIMSHALHSRHVSIVDWHGPVEAEAAFRDAVGACCLDEAFTTAAAEFRLAANSPLDRALNFAPILSRLRAASALDMLDAVLERFVRQGGFSPKAMIGVWVACGVVCLALVVVAVMVGRSDVWAGVLCAIGAVNLYLALLLVYRRFSVHYHLTSQRFVHQSGILRRVTNRIEVIDFDDITFVQGILDRLVNVGTILIVSGDPTDPKLSMPGIENVAHVAHLMDDARRAERRRRGLHIDQR